jgi:hypothetical protein
MASLILVLREGSIKQALITVDGDDAIDQPTQSTNDVVTTTTTTTGRARAGSQRDAG